MDKMEAVKHLDKLNKVINGSNQIIETLDSGKDINILKCIRATMISQSILATELKFVIDSMVDKSNYNSAKYDNDAMKNLGDIFGFNK